MTRCDRCGKEVRVTIMSKFNTDTICVVGPDSCKAKERAHPDYAKADAAEIAAVRSGETNFPGIGKPADL